MDALEARVKFFMLGQENDWNNQGIYLVRLEENCLQFLDEGFRDVIFEVGLADEQTERQSESVICFANRNGNKYAASFQCVEKAQWLWMKMMEYKENKCLAFPSLKNLQKIRDVLNNKSKMNLVTEEWINSLCVSYTENFSKTSSQLYFSIFQSLINSKNISIINGILKHPKFLIAFQVLEEDSKKSFTLNYLSFFQEKVTFINLLSIQNQDMIEDINLAYRLLCLRDSLFSQSFPEETASFLKNMYSKKWDDILLRFQESPTLKIELMQKISSNDPNAFLLIQEIINHSHIVNAFTKSAIFECFKSVNLFKYILESAIFHKQNPKIMSIAIATFKMITKEDPVIIFELFSENCEDLVKIIEASFGSELETFTNFCELISEMINSDYLVDGSDFFNIFSEKLLPSFLKQLSKNNFNKITEFVLVILKICTDCIRTGICSLRNILIESNFNLIIFDIFNLKDKILMIEVVQVIKVQIDIGDEFLVMNLMETGILLRIVETFVVFSVKENLIFSCIFALILKVFESDNLKLISYVEELSKVKKFFVLNFFFPKYLCKAELIISPHDSEGNGKIEKFKNDNLDCLDEINHQLVGTKRNNFENELPIKKPKYVSPR